MFLLLGAIINVAVAWGLAAVGPISAGPTSVVATGWRPWPIQVDGFPPLARQMDITESMGARRNRLWAWTMDASVRDADRADVQELADSKDVPVFVIQALDELDGAQAGAPGRFALEVWSFGWPKLSLRGGEWGQGPDELTRFGVSNAIELTGRTAYGGKRYLPLLPLWPGFVINTIFCAAIVWMLFAAGGRMRRRRRIKRGLCPKCAYDLRGSDSKICPECGTAVKA